MKFSIRLNNDLAIQEYVALAQTAEAAGFDQIWVSHDLFWRSSPVILTAVALATERIEIGTGILNPYTIHPSEIAMLAATLDEVSTGRFNLGISAGAEEFINWVGIAYDKPLTTTREAILAIRSALDGAPVSGWMPDAYMRFGERKQVPIYLGATSPRMLRLAGELADGVLPLLFPPEHFATVQPLVAAGATSAGRSMDEVDLAACVWCSISDDRDAAEEALREKVAYYIHALSGYLTQRLGLDDAELAAIERAMMTDRDPAKARSLVTPEMLRIGIVGTPSDLIERCEELVALGAKHLSFGPPLGPDPRAAVEAIGRAVIPHFRQRRSQDTPR